MPESLPQPILIVDSDEQSINHISSGLKDKGFLVITAPDGYDGYVRARNEAPKVIIVNDLLPYVSGFKLSKLIKSDDRHTDTKIVIMTNTTGSAIDKMFKQHNLAAFIPSSIVKFCPTFPSYIFFPSIIGPCPDIKTDFWLILKGT